MSRSPPVPPHDQTGRRGEGGKDGQTPKGDHFAAPDAATCSGFPTYVVNTNSSLKDKEHKFEALGE